MKKSIQKDENAKKRRGSADRASGHPSRYRRKALRFFVIAAAFLSLLVVMIGVAPKYVARWVVSHELKKMGVQMEGIQTLAVDVWNSEIVFGPVEFWATEGRHGQIGYAGFGYDLMNLFKQKALIEHFLIKEVDIRIDRLRNGSITIDGIGIDRFFDTSAKAVDADAEKSWGFGADTFQVRQSRFIFADYTGGTLTVDVDKLVLRDFQSWSMDAPGSFDLEARINDIGYKWKGKAQVFAPTKTLSLKGTVEKATLAKIAAFTGPVGFIDRSGTFDSEGSHEITLFPDHRIRIESNAALHVNNVDIKSESDESLRLQAGTIRLKTRLQIEPHGTNHLEGSIGAAAEKFSLRTEDGTSLAVDAMEADFSELNIRHQPKGVVGLPGASAKVDVKAATEDDAALPLVQLLVTVIEKLAAQLEDDMVSARGTLALSLEGAEASLPGSKDTPAIKARIDDWEATFTRMEVDTTAPKVKARAQIETTCTEITLGIVDPEGETQLSAGQLHVAVEDYKGERENETVSVDTTGSAKLKNLKVSRRSPTGQSEFDLNFADLNARYDDLALHKTPESTEADGRLQLRVSGLDTKVGNTLVLLAKEGAAGLSEVRSRRKSGSIAVDITGSAELTGTKMSFPDANGGSAINLTAGTFRADLQKLETISAASRTKLRGPVKALASEMSINVPEGPDTLKLKAGSVTASLPEFRADVGDPQSSLDIVGTADLKKFDVLIPAGPGRPRIEAAAASLDLSVHDFPARFGEQSQWRSTLDANAQKLSVDLNEGTAGAMRTDEVVAKGLKADQTFAVALNELAFVGVDADILDQSFKAFSGRDEKKGDAAAKSEDRLKFRLGRLTVARGSAVRYTDTAVEPHVRIRFAIEEFEIDGVDTADPELHTAFKLDTGIDDATRLTADGWATPLKAPTDFDVTARAQRVHLPTFSPYFGKKVGYVADKGDLTADVALKSDQNALEGKVQLKIKDLGLEPVSDHTVEPLKGQPMPIDIAVAALEDMEGTIALEFGITGTLDKPHIDYAQALQKALQGKVGSFLRMPSPGESGGTLSMHPIVFKPGSIELGDEGRAHLDQLANLLLQRPGLAVQVCGQATVEDFTALFSRKKEHGISELFSKDWWESLRRAAEPRADSNSTEKLKPSKEQEKLLRDLARKRMHVVTQYLIRDQRIDGGRIAECQASYSSEEKASPRVEFFLRSSPTK